MVQVMLTEFQVDLSHEKKHRRDDILLFIH